MSRYPLSADGTPVEFDPRQIYPLREIGNRDDAICWNRSAVELRGWRGPEYRGPFVRASSEKEWCYSRLELWEKGRCG